jgi:EAL domain-containing protein (putative c-di-GMP-specific phosphodiesterase class I)
MGVAARNELLDALRTGQFALHYEVQVDRRGHPVGAEAIIRWMHPAYQERSSGTIITLAELTGLFAPLGGWVLEEACVKLARWKQNPRTEHMALAINVSRLEFGEKDFATRVQTTISCFAVDPSLLTMEIAETARLSDTQQTVANMTALRNLGVKFSLDNLGTGYSSLSYLRDLPIDELKIGSTFVHDNDPRAVKIVQSTIDLAQSLGLRTVALGVENEAQRDRLWDFGFDKLQGNLFAGALADLGL